MLLSYVDTVEELLPPDVARTAEKSTVRVPAPLRFHAAASVPMSTTAKLACRSGRDGLLFVARAASLAWQIRAADADADTEADADADYVL
eukprot:2808676-Pleurochrysis_carterae.AAC.2